MTAASAPGLRDPWLVAILAGGALLLARSWAAAEGYQIADSVEYLERAQAFVRGEEVIDSQAIRPFGFSGLLVPLFWIADRIGLEARVHIVHAAQLLQVLTALALAWLAARLGARLGGRVAGLGAAALVVGNPIVLRWGIEPVSGLAAAVFVALALERAFARRNKRNGLLAGVWLGLAVMMSYQVILVAGAIALAVTLRDLRRRRPFLAALYGGLLACLLLQCVLDYFYYGEFGVSVWIYFAENAFTNVARVMERVGKQLEGWGLAAIGGWLRDESRVLYNWVYGVAANTMEYQARVRVDEAHVRSASEVSWYFTNLGRCLVAPAAALIVLGVLRAVARPDWRRFLLLFVVVLNVGVMSIKGSKDFRLWLPFLALLAAFGGLGFDLLLSAARSERRLQAGVGLLLVASVWALGVRENASTNTRKYGGYWRAIDFVGREAERTLESRAAAFALEVERRVAEGVPRDELTQETPRVRLSAAYHWSMLLRESPLVELVKLPHHLDAWNHYAAEWSALQDAGEAPPGTTPEKWQADFEELDSLDYFITHLPVLTNHPDLFDFVNRRFVVLACFYDRVVYETLGPIYVLGRRRGAPGERALFEIGATPDFEEQTDLVLERRFPDGRRHELRLLGWRFEPLPGDGHGWLTYLWQGGGYDGVSYTFRLAIEGLAGRHAFLDTWQPAYARFPTSKWGPGTLLREGRLVVAESIEGRDAYLREPRLVGGAYRRGDLVPADLWLDVTDGHPEFTDRMSAVDPRNGAPAEAATVPGGFPAPSGQALHASGPTLVGRCFLPVRGDARWRRGELPEAEAAAAAPADEPAAPAAPGP